MSTTKKTDNCCRVCSHYAWGWSKKFQLHETRVCLMKPKRYSHSLDNLVPHYYVAIPNGYCENFERRNYEQT